MGTTGSGGVEKRTLPYRIQADVSVHQHGIAATQIKDHVRTIGDGEVKQQVVEGYTKPLEKKSGADRTRTCTPVRELDPKSSASASSATAPGLTQYHFA